MKFAQWNANKRYHPNFAPGWIPDGATVQFNDRTTGRVVHGNGNRSLIEYYPTTGGGWQREWFNNSELRVQS